MHSHLAIIGTNGELTLKPDTSLNVTDKNPMFNDVEMFTQTIPLPFDLNRRVLKNMDDVNSTMRSADVQGERFQFVLDGIPFRNTAIKIQEGTKLDGTIDVNFDATNRTFKDMIADLRCRDVSVDDDILIGEKIGDVKVTMDYTQNYYAVIQCNKGTLEGYQIVMKPVHMVETFQPPVLGFSFPGECYQNYNLEADPDPTNPTKTYTNCNKKEDLDGNNITVKVPHVKTSYINVSQPYPAKKYCNSRICYAHYAAKKENDKDYTGETSDEVVKSKDKTNAEEDCSPYWVLDANRPASGICFYVGYFLERLFKTLGVAYDMTALTNIEDFNYLAFFSTGCHYNTGESMGAFSGDFTAVNKWLESRGCGGQIKLDDNDQGKIGVDGGVLSKVTIASDDYASWSVIGDHGYNNQLVSDDITNADGSITINWGIGSGTGATIVPGSVGGSENYVGLMTDYNISYSVSAKVLRMYANSDNFPNVNVSEIIESLENSFGVRFVYDAEINKVTVKLLRDMFRDQQAPIPFKGTVLKMVKMTESLRGIRMKYSAEQDAQEQRDNIRYQKRDYDTTYNYMDYPQDCTKFASYRDITEKIDVGNRNGYCDLQTGDFFRIKVSADASSTDELQPAIFEVGQYKGVELGDCSEEAERDDAIKEFVSQFEPIMVNDVAYRGKNYAGDYKPRLVPFIDEKMEHEFLIKKMLNPVSTRWGSIDIIYELCLSESYDPSSTDDGQSPLMSHDWGLTIGFLRPAREHGGIVEYERNYDGFDNSKWRQESEDYAITSDTMDVFGTFYGTSDAGSFSLKPRAWKPFRYKYVTESGQQVLKISTNPKQWESEEGWLIPCIEDERDLRTGMITKRIRSRGMCDTWMIEFFRFLLERQKYYVEALCTAAELADIPNKWLRRWEIDGKVGWINIMTYPVNTETGLGKVEIEFYAL